MADENILGVIIKRVKISVGPKGYMATRIYPIDDKEFFLGYEDLYLMSLKPGVIQDFHYHKQGMDVMGCPKGRSRVVLYDMREDSPTCGKIQELELGDYNLITLVKVPPMVAHGFQGLGEEDSLLIDFPKGQSVPGGDFFVNPKGSIPYTWPT
jgi:dTDP-4-dehydrorhamnose 3,5-epimerase